MIKKDGLDIREHFSRNLAEAFELDSNGDFQPSPMNKYIVDTKWDLDDNGDLQMGKENYGLCLQTTISQISRYLSIYHQCN